MCIRDSLYTPYPADAGTPWTRVRYSSRKPPQSARCAYVLYHTVKRNSTQIVLPVSYTHLDVYKRQLLKNPKVLILDDSTSAVDTATDAKIRAAFRESIPGTTKIIIAQRISSVQDADRILAVSYTHLFSVRRAGMLEHK